MERFNQTTVVLCFNVAVLVDGVVEVLHAVRVSLSGAGRPSLLILFPQAY